MKSIRTKLTIAMSLLAAAVLAFTGIVLMVNITVDYRSDFYTTVTAVLDRERLPKTADTESLVAFLDANDKGLQSGSDKNCYILKDGNVVSSTNEGGILRSTENLNTLINGGECRESELFSPVLDYGVYAGDGYAVYVTDTHNQLYSQIGSLGLHLIQALLLGVLLAVGISWVLSKRLTRSLRALGEGARRITEGDFSGIEISSADEIGQLAGVMNSMGAQIQKDYDEFEREERRRREFVANVSHELKTPLTVIKSYSQTLNEMEVDRDTAREFLSVIDSEVDRMTLTVSQLLQISRLEAGPDAAPEEVDLAKLCGGIADALALEIKAKALTITLSGGGKVICERAKAHTILTNIIENAVKYTERGGIEIEIEDNTVTVRDSGIGMTKEDAGHIFERFYRADKARGRKTGGTGLGLAIAKECADAIGAKITVDSKLNEYTSFTVEFK